MSGKACTANLECTACDVNLHMHCPSRNRIRLAIQFTQLNTYRCYQRGLTSAPQVSLCLLPGTILLCCVSKRKQNWVSWRPAPPVLGGGASTGRRASPRSACGCARSAASRPAAPRGRWRAARTARTAHLRREKGGTGTDGRRPDIATVSGWGARGSDRVRGFGQKLIINLREIAQKISGVFSTRSLWWLFTASQGRFRQKKKLSQPGGGGGWPVPPV